MTTQTHPQTETSTPPRAGTRGFWSLIGLQAQGAFNDNVFKMILQLWALSLFSADAAKNTKYNAIITGLIPGAFLIFSCWAGMLADKFSKRSIILVTKVAEFLIGIAALVVILWSDQQGEMRYAPFMMFMLVSVLLFIHSAFFSPSKYGIIPELVPEEKISWANGMLGLTTFVAIILGCAGTTLLFDMLTPNRLHYLAAGLIVLSVIGFGLGLRISHTPAANPHRKIEINYLPELKRYVTTLFHDRTLGLTVCGLAYFWGLGAILLPHVLVWGTHSLGLQKTGAGLLFVDLALGIGIGSALAGIISKNRIQTGLVPLGCLGIAAFCLPLAFATPALLPLMVISLFMVGISAGLYSVPLQALLQARTDPRDRGGLLAASAYFTDSTMVLAAIFYWFLGTVLALTSNHIFLVISLITFAGVFVVLRLLPEELLRFVTYLLVKVVYRIRVFGAENIPATGPALLVSNHVSFVDALLIQATAQRKVRFVVWEGLFRNPLMRYFLKTTQCIPVSTEQSPREMLKSLKQAAEVLKEGELLCIFAEGQITRTGNLNAFHRGYSIILKEAPAPVVPICLDGVWGSIFSFEGGKFFWKWPRQIPYRVRMMIGKALPATVEPFTLHQAIQELGADAAIARGEEIAILPETLVKQCRRNWGRFLMVDILSPPIKMGQGLWRAVILARRLAPLWKGQPTVGVMLPPSTGGALANFAAALAGRTVVNLNYTTGQAVLDSCARRAGLKTVVTARAFLEKTGLQAPAEAIFIEDYRGFRGFGEVITAILAARFFSVRRLMRMCGCEAIPKHDSLATIIFSSGSTGEPKGVMLTHAMIASNAESFHRGVRTYRNDRMLGTLPFFHSFGYTVSMWGSIFFPMGMVYHFNPLDVKTIGELCEKHHVTIIVTTPTFLQAYLRRIPPAQFGGLTTVVTGAERLPESLRIAFRDRFGIDSLQGYGTTECAPVVSVNIDNIRQPGIFQLGHKPGSIGQPLPGIAVKITNIDTGEEQPQGQPGLLLVKGANVMQGYLGMPEKTAEVLKDGWYNTGDVAYLDEDGFVFITDRLSRFSKIGGEMVPHVTLEEKIHETLGLSEQKLVVTAVPDAKKGEQLVILHVLEDKDFDGLLEKLAGAGLPNLWIPRRENTFKVEAIPLLGTGKLDLQGIRKVAQARVAERGAGAAGQAQGQGED